MPAKFIPCVIKALPSHAHIDAATLAVEINPANRPLSSGMVLPPQHLAAITTKLWPSTGVRVTVGFMDAVQADLRNRIILHMNSWGAYCNVSFTYTSMTSSAFLRVSLGPGGYWSYLGTDNMMIQANEQTMNLEGFTMDTPESEFVRVVRHETGHFLGFPHEHLRREIVQLLDPKKTIAYFKKTYGWSAAITQQQVLTPLEEASIRGTPHADQDSIMCYQLPAAITTNGQPITGGVDIDVMDRAFANTLYPLAVIPPPPPPPPPAGITITLSGKLEAGTYKVTQ